MNELRCNNLRFPKSQYFSAIHSWKPIEEAFALQITCLWMNPDAIFSLVQPIYDDNQGGICFTESPFITSGCLEGILL